MGFQSVQAAYGVTVGKPGTKAVLLSLAWHACDSCGIAWPGHKAIAADTEIGRSRISEALAELVAAGWLAVYRFPNGGRGLSTEYIVLQSVRKLSTAPCAECRKRMKNVPQSGPFTAAAAEKSPQGGRIGGKPSGKSSETVQTGNHQQSVTYQQSGSASPHESEPGTSPGENLFSEPPPRPTIPESAQDALRALGITLPTPKPEPRPA